jgi:alpha-N-acetylglucosaminidase
VLLDDIDQLLATQKDFLLGPWIHQARRCGKTFEEKVRYEQNARNLITLWGGKDNRLHEYSCRQWSGLISDFYKPRWKQFFEVLDTSLKTDAPADFELFESKIKAWEWSWVNTQKEFPTEPRGHSVDIVKQLHRKYKDNVEKMYKVL